MTDAEIRDAAVQHLKATTVGYINKHWTTPPLGTEWRAALDLLAQIGAAPPPPPPSGQYPPFTPKRTITVTTVSGFDGAVSSLLPGDLVVCKGTFPGQRTIGKRLTDWAVLDLTQAVFSGGSRSAGNYVGLYYRGCCHIRTIGGEFTNPGGDGIRVELGCDSVDIYEPRVHNVGTQGILVQGNGAANTNIRIVRGEAWACGNTAYDPHTQKGTGLHCVYFGGGPDFTSSGDIIDFYAHDQPYGCGVQIGGRVSSLNVVNPRIERITGGNLGDAGGNCFNIWSESASVSNVLISGAHGSDISGWMVLDNDLNSPAGSIHMTGSRFTNVTKGRNASGNPAVVYTDCVP